MRSYKIVLVILIFLIFRPLEAPAQQEPASLPAVILERIARELKKPVKEIAAAALPGLGLLGGCGSLLPKPPPSPALYALDDLAPAASLPLEL